MDGTAATPLPTPIAGKKFDKGKARFDLFPMRIVEEAAEIMTFGAEKYGEDNWRLPMQGRRGRWFSACLRHIFAYWRGEELDPESGKNHLAHALCNLMFLMETKNDAE